VTLGERVLGGLVERNNALAASRTRSGPNPWHIAEVPGLVDLVGSSAEIAAEWRRFQSCGGRLPRLDDVLGEPQGAEGTWRAGLLLHRGQPVSPLADDFPGTVAALQRVVGLHSALWSVLAPGTELPEHHGPNAGVLRFHLGVECGDAAGLRVAGIDVPYRDGVGILFDDTAPHSAWNRGERDRVTLFCELLRPLPRSADLANRGVQALLSLDARYRCAPRRAQEWHRALNRGASSLAEHPPADDGSRYPSRR
jgi:beta-hydroxylase